MPTPGARSAEALGEGDGDLLGLWARPTRRFISRCAPTACAHPCVLSVGLKYGGFPSIGRHHAPAIRLERTIRDLYGHSPIGAPDRRPWLDHGAWGVRAPLGAAEPSERRDPADYDFLPVHGEGLHEIPVGPVHAGIIEPGHFRFTANGETVVRLEERLGYVHKGIDGLLTDADLARAQTVVARVSGNSTVALSFAFARAVEAAARGRRAAARRGPARRDGGARAHRQSFRRHRRDLQRRVVRASSMRIAASCASACSRRAMPPSRHRLMMDRIVPGGVAQDLAGDGASAILAMLDEIEPRFAEIVRLYDDTPSLQDRTCNDRHRGAGPGRALGSRRLRRPRLGTRLSMPAAISPTRLTTRSRSTCRSFPRAT